MKKFCTKCGKPFESIGREVICPACKAQAAEDAKRAAVMKAKAKSWTGESVPVRISGRASTVIREYGKEEKLSFAAALDELLKSTDYFKKLGIKWENIIPYRSRRRDKAAADKAASDFLHGKQDAPQDVTSKPQDVPQEVTNAAKVASKATTSKATSKTSTAKKANKQTAVKTVEKKEVKA